MCIRPSTLRYYEAKGIDALDVEMSACDLAISYLLFSCFYSIGVPVALRQGPRLKRQFEFMNRLIDRAHRAGSRQSGGGRVRELGVEKRHGRSLFNIYNTLETHTIGTIVNNS
jgi:hypothetical protein